MGYDRENSKFWWYHYGRPWLIATVCIAMLWLAGLLIYNFALDNGREGCTKFGAQTNYATEYRNLFWGKWECFVNVNGQWIPDQQVRIMGGND